MRYRAIACLALLFIACPAGASVWAHYSFDTNYADVSGNGQHGVLTDVGTPGNSGITSVSGNYKFGSGAMNFSTDRDYLAIPSKTFNSGSYSIAFWAKKAPGDTGGAADWDMVIGQRDNINFFVALNDVNGTGLRWRGSDRTADRQADFAVPKDYQWHHYALVASGTTMSMYLDGEFFGSKTGLQTGFVLNTIGEAYTASAHYDFNGQLDEVWIFDESLDADAVRGLYESNTVSPPPPPVVNRVRIVLLGGQSNADGRAAVSGLPTNLQSPQSDVDLYYRVEGKSGALTTLRPGLSETSQFGPEITLGRGLADAHAQETGTRVAIIKYANGGTNLHTQWKAGGDATTSGDGPEYVAFQQTVTPALSALAAKYPQATLELDAMVWMQGESDATSTGASAYQANLAAFIADIRATYGASLPFVIGRLSDQQTAINATYRNQVRTAQENVAAASPITSFVSTDGFGMNGDNLHFSAVGQQSLGSAFAVEVGAYVASP